MKRWISVAAIAAALAVLCWHAAGYLPFLSDDALISLRYAQRFLHGQGLTWTDGEAVEGYSNLLWVLACAGLGAVGIDLVDAARVLGFAGMGAALVLVAGAQRELLPRLVAGLLLALAGPIAVWAVGGLEQPLVAVLLAWALIAGRRVADGDDRVLWTAVPLALLCLTRPDGPLFTAAVALALPLCRGLAGVRLAARVVVLPLAAFAGQLVFRLAYYGDWVANTARVKAAFSVPRLLDGLAYVGHGTLWLAGLGVLALLALVPAAWEHAYRRRVILYTVPLLAWAAYVAAVGGDIFPARRHLVPLVVIKALLAGELLGWAVRRGRALQVAGWAVGLGCVAALGYLQLHDRENELARRERWEWDGQRVGVLLQRAFGPRKPLLAVDSAGALPYWAELPALDLLGLNDRWLALHPPKDLGEGYIGHELGDGPYVLSRQPDLLVFCVPTGSDRGCFRSGRQLVASRDFRAAYTPVTFADPGPRTVLSRIWVRREGGPIGLVRSTSLLEIPGHLFAFSDRTPAVLDEQGRIGVRVAAETPGKLPRLQIPAGTWRISAQSSGPAPILQLLSRGTTAAEAQPGLTFHSDGATYDLQLGSPSGTTHVRSVTLERVGDLAGN